MSPSILRSPPKAGVSKDGRFWMGRMIWLGSPFPDAMK